MDPAAQALELVVDDRELKSPTVRKLFSLGVKLHPQRLDIGDYLIGASVGLERKTSSDFEDSIIDGRLFSQARDLSGAFSAPVLAVIGSDYSRLSPAAIRGAEISLATDFRIPLFHFPQEDDLAHFLHALAMQKGKPKTDPALRVEKKTFSLAQQQQFVVESIASIGPRHAKSLLSKFQSVQNVFNASEQELQQADGIGPARAKEIRRIASSIYSPG